MMVATIVTKSGRVSIPEEIREALGLRDGESVAVEQVDNGILLRRNLSVVERTFGALGAYMTGPSLTPAEEREAFEAGVAAEVAAELAEEAKRQ